MSRYLVLLKAGPQSTPPPPELMEAILKLGAEATEAGALVDTAGLAPSAAGSRLAVRNNELTVTDGPFAEAKETISYALYQVDAKAEAVTWASRFLELHQRLWPGWEGEAEVLQVYS